MSTNQQPQRAEKRIRVTEATRQELFERKESPGESYDDVIRRELDLE